MRSIVVDVETTKLTLPSCVELEKQPRIIEFGCAIIENGVVMLEASWLIHPGEPITPEITKITGITDEVLAEKPPFKSVLPDIRRAFEGVDLFIAHNATFDMDCLKYELQRAGCKDFPWPPETICTVQEYVHEFGRRPKLTELYEHLLGKPLKQQHRALNDVRALVEIVLQQELA